jgi:hypothetical protein
MCGVLVRICVCVRVCVANHSTCCPCIVSRLFNRAVSCHVNALYQSSSTSHCRNIIGLSTCTSTCRTLHHAFTLRVHPCVHISLFSVCLRRKKDRQVGVDRRVRLSTFLPKLAAWLVGSRFHPLFYKLFFATTTIVVIIGIVVISIISTITIPTAFFPLVFFFFS